MMKHLNGLTIVDANTGCGCNLAAILYESNITTHHVFAAEPDAKLIASPECDQLEKLRYVAFHKTSAQLYDYMAKEMKVDMTHLGLVICYPYPHDSTEDDADYSVLRQFKPLKCIIFVGWHIENNQIFSCSGSVKLWNQVLGPLGKTTNNKIALDNTLVYKLTQHAQHTVEDGKSAFVPLQASTPVAERHLYFDCFILERLDPVLDIQSKPMTTAAATATATPLAS